jgi:4-hydroxy-tetrahydrodipicolinate synthase
MAAAWTRVFPALTTPFRDDESLDLAAMERHIEALIDAGIGGLTVCGSVGENYALETEEKLAVVRTAVKMGRGKLPVLAGVAETTTKFATRYMAACERLGVDGFMVLPTLIYKTQPDETMRHFRTVARATKLPIMIYNNPIAYGGDVTPKMFQELADEPNIVALKESSTDIRRVLEIKMLCGERYVIFAGMDDIAVESVLGGAKAFVAGIVNAFPRETVAMFDLALAGRYDEAMAINRWLAPLVRYDNDPRFVHYMKFFTMKAGLGSETVRLPRLPLSGEDRKRAEAAVDQCLKTRPSLPKLTARAAE